MEKILMIFYNFKLASVQPFYLNSAGYRLLFPAISFVNMNDYYVMILNQVSKFKFVENFIYCIENNITFYLRYYFYFVV